MEMAGLNSRGNSVMLPENYITELAIRALEEDLGRGDVTSSFIAADSERCRAAVVVRERAVVSGVLVAEEVFRQTGVGSVQLVHTDGDEVDPSACVLEIEGTPQALLAGERVALNFLQQLSGVATSTRAYVDVVEGLAARIVDTRKTVPGLRLAQKAAVRHGGGCNHRFRLDDGILIKDNHLAIAAAHGMPLEDVVADLRRGSHHLLRIEVEIDEVDMVGPAIDAGVDAILLDNMSPDIMRDVVASVRQRAGDSIVLEASGNVTLDTVRAIAETGVDLISVGELTHSAPAVDYSMEIRG